MDNDTGFTRIQDCMQTHPDVAIPNNELLLISTAMEKEFKCSGVCTPTEFYVFTDTMRGRPTKTCS